MNNKQNFLEDYLLFLNRVDSLEKMDEFILNLNKEIYQKYPCISCNTGCYTCCTATGMPNVYSNEWERIKEYLKKLSVEEISKIKENNNYFVEEHSELINTLNDFIHKNSKSNYDNLITEIEEKFKDKLCPFHIEGKCSIYSVRPSMCRAYGSFLFISEKEEKLLSCDENKDNLNDFISKNKIRNTMLPYWNTIDRKIKQLSDKTKNKHDFTVIPIWLRDDFFYNNDFEHG